MDCEYFHEESSNNNKVEDKLNILEVSMKVMANKMIKMQNEIIKLKSTKYE